MVYHPSDAPHSADPGKYLDPASQAPVASTVSAGDYSCPMHPEVRQATPGSCPKCGMALEKVLPVATATGIIRPIQLGSAGFVLLLVIYFAVVSLISGKDFALDQFAKFWYFIVLLALGFGIQVGLYVHLKNLVAQQGASGKVVAVAGTTSTAAMISCCAHYLANVVPILGVAGFLTVVAEYQIELFWVGLAFNVAGMLYVGSKILKSSKEISKC